MPLLQQKDELFEEAAGVSKYKERRKETENRLSDTRDNLTRVEDILRELNGQIDKLEQQAAIAGEFRALEGERADKQHWLWMIRRDDALAEQARIESATRKSRLSNSLAIVIRNDSALKIHSANDLTNAAVQRVAIADPRIVPAGVYAKSYLEKMKLWRAIEPKMITTENVRGALAAVESGNVEAGIVYKTDAAISKKVKVACEIPRHAGPDIRYPMALLKEAEHPEAARKFLHFLDSKTAAKIFEQFGFTVLNE